MRLKARSGKRLGRIRIDSTQSGGYSRTPYGNQPSEGYTTSWYVWRSNRFSPINSILYLIRLMEFCDFCDFLMSEFLIFTFPFNKIFPSIPLIMMKKGSTTFHRLYPQFNRFPIWRVNRAAPAEASFWQAACINVSTMKSARPTIWSLELKPP